MMDNNQNNKRKRVGLQIGGTVGPNDIVGMHIPMPTVPGIGVKVVLGNEFEDAVKEVDQSIPDSHPKAAEIHKIVEEVLATKDQGSRIKKVQTLVMIGAGITQIAVGIAKITKLLGF